MTKKTSVKILALIMTTALLIGVLCACGAKNNGASPAESTTSSSSTQGSRVQVTMADDSVFVIELYPEYAPKTVENFLNLVNSGFYNGLTFHRVVDNFMAQGGDPEGTGRGGAENTIEGEFNSNGFSQNTLSHTRGVVSMARSTDNNSASSQFFICYTDDSTFLDGIYAAFGKVVDGMEVVDDFCKVERTMNSSGELATPVEPIIMKEVKVIG